MKLRLRSIPHLLALVAAPCALAACDPGVAPATAPLGGTYTGASGAAAYTLVIPETRATPFGVTGTIVEGGARHEVRGTGIRTGDRVTLELMRTRDDLEDVFGFSGTVGRAGDEIALRGAGSELVVRRD